MHFRNVSHINPYSVFENDRERRIALRNRDIRLVLISIASVAAANGSEVLELLLSVFRTTP